MVQSAGAVGLVAVVLDFLCDGGYDSCYGDEVGDAGGEIKYTVPRIPARRNSLRENVWSFSI